MAAAITHRLAKWLVSSRFAVILALVVVASPTQVCAAPEPQYFYRVREIVVSHQTSTGLRNPRSRVTAFSRASRLRRRLIRLGTAEDLTVAAKIKRFAHYAMLFSDAPTRDQGGLIVSAATLANYSEQVAGFLIFADFGAVSEVVETPAGWTLYVHEPVVQFTAEVLTVPLADWRVIFPDIKRIKDLKTHVESLGNWRSVDSAFHAGTNIDYYQGWLSPTLLSTTVRESVEKQTFAKTQTGALLVVQTETDYHFFRKIPAPPVLVVEHILVSAGDNQGAAKLLIKLAETPLDFAKTRTSRSLDDRRYLALTPFSQQGLAPLYEASKSLKLNQFATYVIASEFGAHIIRRLR